jgi:AraC-like DNA-binding protein
MSSAPYFQYLRRAPAGALAPVVRESWSMRAEHCRTAVEAALPDGAVELYFNLGPAGRHLGDRQHSTPRRPRGAWIIGPRERPLLIEKEIRDCDVVGVRLHPGTAACVLGVPAIEIRAGMHDLDLFWGAEVNEIRDRLAATPDPGARLSIVECAVARRLARSTTGVGASMARALCDTIASSIDESIGSIAARTGLSHRRLIALVHEMVGLKPKAFQRVQRLRRVFRLVDHVPRLSWTAIAHRSGYFDQAHMINDFRGLTGVRPAEYARTKTSVGEGFMPYRLAPGLERSTIEGLPRAASQHPAAV